MKRIAARLKHGNTARPRVEPDVEDVRLLAEIRTVAFRARKAFGEQVRLRAVVPCVGGFDREDIRYVIDDRRICNGLIARLAVEYGYRHAPRTLARNAPVGAALEHVAHPPLAPRRVPIDL